MGRFESRQLRPPLVLALCAVCAVGEGAWLVHRISEARLARQVTTTRHITGGRGYTVPIDAEQRDKIGYPFSLVPGGVGSPEELKQRVAHDGALAEHYRGFRYATSRMVRLEADREAYVSYRKEEGIFWTRKKVLLRKGELLLTDGHMVVRSRCGNQVCETPQAPVARTAEPSELEMETPLVTVAPVSGPGRFVPTGLHEETRNPLWLREALAGAGAGGPFLAAGGGVGGSGWGSPGGNPGGPAFEPGASSPVTPTPGSMVAPGNSPTQATPVPGGGALLVPVTGTQPHAPETLTPSMPIAEVITNPPITNPLILEIPTIPPGSATGGTSRPANDVLPHVGALSGSESPTVAKPDELISPPHGQGGSGRRPACGGLGGS